MWPRSPARGSSRPSSTIEFWGISRASSLVEIRLETGRTHQIRAQFSARGLPLAGDRKYSKYPDPQDWQIALWSSHLAFTHPETGEAMDFRLPPPSTAPWTLFQAQD